VVNFTPRPLYLQREDTADFHRMGDWVGRRARLDVWKR
jgi:hypothetical protein